MKVIYIGLQEETLNIIQEHLRLPQALFQPVEEESTLFSPQDIEEAGLILIGENTKNPIQITQKVYGVDRNISILIINEASNIQKIRQSLLFTPFIGPTVHAVSNVAGKGLVEVVKDHIQRTQQRRSYQKFQSSFVGPALPSTQRTERIKADYLNKAMEEAPVGLVLINKNSNILSFNKYATTLFNKSEREVMGTFLPDLFPEEARNDLFFFFGHEETSDRQKRVEYLIDGELRVLEIVLSRVDKEDPAYKIVLINDISEQVAGKKAVEESAQKVKMIVDSMPEMAWTALPNGEIDYLNRRWHEYTGQSLHGFPATAWQKAIHPEDLDKAQIYWNKALKEGSLYQLECRYLRASDNEYRWHLTRACPVKNSQGAILHWVGTCTDVQSLKNTELELQKTANELASSNEELMAANEEITASVEELHETNERLTKVNAEMDNFIYTASHDLKAPILNVEGLVQVLSRKLNKEVGENKQVQEMLEMINFSIQRFKATIGDLTEIVKLQRLSGLESTQINIKEIVHEVELDLYQQILEADAQLEIQVEGNPIVFFSRKNVKSIIYNLLSNAIKYRSIERTLTIRISIFEERDFLVLTVNDNGLGMNLKDQSKVFGMFQRMHSHVEGTGIGLYIVKKIIEDAGGKIGVESQVGEGSTFRVTFPKAVPKAKASPL